MKYFFTFVLFIVIAAGCKRKVLSGVELQNKLVETMQDYLDKDAKPGVQFKVKDVTYFPVVKSKSYLCEFHVDMRTNNTDTVGTMKATISNDFKKVERTR